jgi:DNA-binding response OmpR family regulator
LLSGARPLIVEDEFLIAMDMQRVLEGAAAGQAVLTRNYDEAAALGERLSGFDLAIVTPPRPDGDDEAVAGRLIAAGVAVVVCSAARAHLAGTVLADAEFVDKPFADEELVAACLRALERRRRQADR